MSCLRMSASCISCFKQCKMRFFYQYMLGLQPNKDTDALRIGSRYHDCREIIGKLGLRTEENEPMLCWGKAHQHGKHCLICGSEKPQMLKESSMMHVMQYLDNYYETLYEGSDAEKMMAERSMLLNAMVGYQWRYGDDENITMLGTEFRAEQRLFDPFSGREVDDAVLVYVCDGIMQYEGALRIREYKTTSKPVGSDSTFWANLNLAIQPNMYIYCLTQAQRQGQLASIGIPADGPEVRSIVYDVFHKPGLKPGKALSQKASVEFVDTGNYMGTEFDVKDTDQGIFVDGVEAETKAGAKEGTFAINETMDMYGARILGDIVERPDFYLARRTFSKTDADLIRTEKQLFNIYQSIRSMEAQHSWYTEEESCEATFKCPFMSLCYENVDVEGMLAKGNVPDGFRVYKREETK